MYALAVPGPKWKSWLKRRHRGLLQCRSARSGTDAVLRISQGGHNMDLLIIMAGHLLTLCGALVALIGDTWDKSKPKFKRLTSVGWVAAVIATTGIGVSTYQSYEKYQTDLAYKELALNDIRGGWGQVASPWALTLWEVTGERNDVTVSTLEEVLDNLEAFDGIDLGMTSKVLAYGEKTLGNLYCQQSSMGVNIMERAVQFNVAVLPRDVAAAVRRLRQECMFARLLEAGCSNLQRDTPNYSLLRGKFSSTEGKSYLVQLIELGKLLEVR